MIPVFVANIKGRPLSFFEDKTHQLWVTIENLFSLFYMDNFDFFNRTVICSSLYSTFTCEVNFPKSGKKLMINEHGISLITFNFAFLEAVEEIVKEIIPQITKYRSMSDQSTKLHRSLYHDFCPAAGISEEDILMGDKHGNGYFI